MRELDSTVFVNEEMNHADDELDVLFWELGKAYYEGGFEDPLPQLLPLFDKITSIKRKDEQLAIERPNRESKQCGTCGEVVSENARFCRKCGTSVDNASNDEPLKKYCGNCGQKLGSDMAFCMKCGTPVT